MRLRGALPTAELGALWRRPAAVLLIAVVLRLWVVTTVPWSSTDVKGYDQLALNLLAGHGFSWSERPPYSPNLYRTPVYPLFLAVFFRLFGYPTAAVFVAQALLGAGTCGLVYFIARRFWPDRVAVIACFFNAASPFLVYYTAVRLTETVHTFLMGCGICAWVYSLRDRGSRKAVVAGVFLGTAILCRPEVAFFPLFLACCTTFLPRPDRARAAPLMVMLVSAYLVVLPWLVRNYQITGRVGFLVKGGPAIAFWLTTLPYFSLDTFRLAPGFEGTDALLQEGLENRDGRFETGERDARLWREGVEHIRKDPWGYAWRRVRDYSHLWVPSGDYLLGPRNRSFHQAVADGRYGLVAVKGLLLLVTGLLPLSLALLGLVVDRHRLGQLLPLWVLPLYVSLTRIPFDIQPRLSLPAQPYMLAFAAYGAVWLWTSVVQRRDRGSVLRLQPLCG